MNFPLPIADRTQLFSAPFFCFLYSSKLFVDLVMFSCTYYSLNLSPPTLLKSAVTIRFKPILGQFLPPKSHIPHILCNNLAELTMNWQINISPHGVSPLREDGKKPCGQYSIVIFNSLWRPLKVTRERSIFGYKTLFFKFYSQKTSLLYEWKKNNKNKQRNTFCLH